MTAGPVTDDGRDSGRLQDPEVRAVLGDETPPEGTVLEPTATQSAWLVERGQSEKQVPTVWLEATAISIQNGVIHQLQGWPFWTTDANKAQRFDSREHAEAFIGENSRPVGDRFGRATEHVWFSPRVVQTDPASGDSEKAPAGDETPGGTSEIQESRDSHAPSDRRVYNVSSHYSVLADSLEAADELINGWYDQPGYIGGGFTTVKTDEWESDGVTDAGSSSGRTTAFEAANLGSTPSPAVQTEAEYPPTPSPDPSEPSLREALGTINWLLTTVDGDNIPRGVAPVRAVRELARAALATETAKLPNQVPDPGLAARVVTLRRLAEAATPGPWTVDPASSEGEWSERVADAADAENAAYILGIGGVSSTGSPPRPHRPRLLNPTRSLTVGQTVAERATTNPPGIYCGWCGKENRRPSEWEQMRTKDRGYMRLCQSCANRRLGNPYNALLGLRRITETAEQSIPSSEVPRG